MEGYQLRQGTVYRKRDDGSEITLIHHSPMELLSLKISGNDAASAEVFPVDALIGLRRSGDYEEIGDLEKSALLDLADRIIELKKLPEETLAKLTEALKEFR